MELQRKLDVPGSLGVNYLAKKGSQERRGRSIDRGVGEIDELGSKLNPLLSADGEFLLET